MAAHIQIHFSKSAFPATEARVCHRDVPHRSWIHFNNTTNLRLRVSAVDRSNSGSGGGDGSGSSSNSNTNHLNPNNKKKGGVGGAASTSSAASSAASAAEVPSSNYVVPFDKSSCITRPLNEILRDLNKRIPDNIKKTPNHGYDSTFISWYHANRMLSFYAPGWCGEIRDVIFSDNGSVTVVYRVTIRGSDDEAFRESTGTVSSADGSIVDPVAAAEEIAFCRACARFGLGLYLYHEE